MIMSGARLASRISLKKDLSEVRSPKKIPNECQMSNVSLLFSVSFKQHKHLPVLATSSCIQQPTCPTRTILCCHDTSRIDVPSANTHFHRNEQKVVLPVATPSYIQQPLCACVTQAQTSRCANATLSQSKTNIRFVSSFNDNFNHKNYHYYYCYYCSWKKNQNNNSCSNDDDDDKYDDD